MAIDAALGRLGNKSGVCTSSTRPTNPFEGQLIYETDTNRTLVYDNAAWLVVADNQVLSIDTTNGRVGVGTTLPDRTLHVDSPTAAVAAQFSSQHPSLGLIEIEGGASTATAQIGVDGDDIVFRPLVTERLRIDSSGRVTTPYQPAFSAYCSWTDSHSAMSGVQIVPFATVLLNRGNGFLTSGTGAYERFVAPVSGVYWMSISFGVISATTDYYYGMAIYKNGANAGVSHQYYKHSGGGNDDGTSQSFAISLNASDWVDIRTNFQDSKRVQWAVFTGHLLG